MCRICCRCPLFCFCFFDVLPPLPSNSFSLLCTCTCMCIFFPSWLPLFLPTPNILIFLTVSLFRIFLDDVFFSPPSFCNSLVFFKKVKKTQRSSLSQFFFLFVETCLCGLFLSDRCTLRQHTPGPISILR